MNIFLKRIFKLLKWLLLVIIIVLVVWWFMVFYINGTDTKSLIWIGIVLWLLIWFVFFFDRQVKQLTAKKRRVPQLIIVFLFLFIPVVYFCIGKAVQTVPKIPDSYFDRPRHNLDLQASENGLEKLKALIWSTTQPISKEDMEKYPFQSENGAELWAWTMGRNVSQYDEKYFDAPIQFLNPQKKRDYYDTYQEMISDAPSAFDTEKAGILLNSDFFERLGETLDMERRDDDIFPTMQWIQSLERVMTRLSVYLADKWDLERAVEVNLLAVKLGDKYLSVYNSLVQGLIASVSLNMAMDTSEYLLKNYEISQADKQKLTEIYKNILTTDSITAFKNIFKGEYYMMKGMMHNFDFNTFWEASVIGYNDSKRAMILNHLENLLQNMALRKPLYDREVTIDKYKYELEKEAEATLGADLDSTSDSPSRNLYNIVWNVLLSALLPRSQWVFTLIDNLYVHKKLILSLF